MKRILLTLCTFFTSVLLIGQNCDDFIVETKGNSYGDITAAYKELLMKDVDEDATSLPPFFEDLANCWLMNVENTKEIESFSIGEEYKNDYPELIFLIMNSRSLSTDDEKQNWFNLMPMMNREQLYRLYDILERETLKINAIELKYEEKRKLLAIKYNVSVNEEGEENENDLQQPEFKLFGYRVVSEDGGSENIPLYDFNYVRIDGNNYVDGFGEWYNEEDFILIYPSDFYKLRNKVSKEQNRATGWFDDYLSYCYEYLKLLSHDSSLALQDEMSQEWVFGYWVILLEEFRKSLDKSSQLEEMALIPMENMVGKKHSKKQIKMHRYQYLQMVYTNRGDYGAAARCCAVRVENLQNVSPQTFVFNLYLPIISYVDNEWKHEGEILEDKFVQWYRRIDHDAFYEQIPDDYTQATIMVADYYLAFGQNVELKAIVSNIRDSLITSYEKDILRYGKGLEDEKWYGFLTHTYLNGSFADGGLRYEDLVDQVSQAGFKTADTYMVEYACYYCLYQILNNSKPKGNVSSILRKVITKCNDPKSGAFNYVEKDIAMDLLSRNERIDDYLEPYVRWIFPKSKQLTTEEGTLHLSLDVVKGSMSMLDAQVYTEDDTFKNDEFDKKQNVWSFDKSIELANGDNIIIVVYKDSSQIEHSDTIRVVYTPKDYTVRKDIALFFAVDEYDDKEVYKPFKKDGQRPVQDAEDFAAILDDFGFESHIYRNPTAEQIDNTLTQYATKSYEKYDQLLIFFSGHGTTDDVTGVGYFVPKDGNSKRKSRTMISYNDVKELFKMREENNCRHILVIADACHSGSFIKEPKGTVEENAKRIQSEAMEYVTRCFIGSASPNEESDSKSELMSAFIKLFSNKKKDYFDFSDLERAVRDEEGNKKEKGRWGDDQSQSSFYFNRKQK